MPESIDDVSLTVGATTYLGWNSVSIRRSIKTVAGYFELSVIDKWEGLDRQWRLSGGDSCQVSLGGTPVITGYIDSITSSFDANSRSIRVFGRDKTCDLVDCSAIRKSPAWIDVKFEKIASDLTAPFDIPVKTEVDTGKKFESWYISNPGETVFSILDRASRFRSLLLMSDGLGSLLVTRPGMKKSTTLLKEGVNIASILATSDLKGRFSEYHVQTLPITAPEVGQPLPDEGVVIKDPEIRYRPLTIIADGVLWDRQLMKSRANWEACVRKARGNSLVTTLAGWTQEDGSLWDLNCTTQVVSPWLSIDNKTYLTSSLHFQMDDKSGKRTELELEPLDAYLLDPTLRDKESAFSLLTEKESYG